MPAVIYTVQGLAEAVQAVLDHTFATEVWVEGEISSLRRSPAGHVYFDLIDPGPPGQPPAATVPVCLFSSARQQVNRALRQSNVGRIEDGMRVRIRGRVELHAARGRLQLRMSGIDPTYTLGLMVSERDLLVRQLEREGVLRRNAARPLPAFPERLGLVTSDGSAAMADFLHELEASGLGWRVVAVDARVQGAGADLTVVAALRAAVEAGVDAVALVRGGGSRTDLATFDSGPLARAISELPVPVLTGIGHEVDVSVADLVAHTSFKTPTACAAFLVERARLLAERAEGAWGSIARRATHVLDRDRERLDRRAGRASAASRHHVRRHDADLDRWAAALVQRGPRALLHAERRLTGLASHVEALDPQRVLARGWSITRTASGALVRQPGDVAEGDEITTTLAAGAVRSRVAP